MKDIIDSILLFPEFKSGEHWERARYHSNDVIVKTGEKSDIFFLIEEGTVRVTNYVQLEGGKQMQTGISDMGLNEFFGETAINQIQQQRMATVVAITDCCLLKINGLALSSFLDEHVDIGCAFYKFLNNVNLLRLQTANKRVANLMSWGLKVHQVDKYL